jgi:hypothetical protein
MTRVQFVFQLPLGTIAILSIFIFLVLHGFAWVNLYLVANLAPVL